MTVDRFPIEAGHIMMFARAIGDPNPVYADEAYAAGTEVGNIIAPPTFAQASAQYDADYILRPKIGEPWFGSGREATGMTRETGGGGGIGSGLHAGAVQAHVQLDQQGRPGVVASERPREALCGDRAVYRHRQVEPVRRHSAELAACLVLHVELGQEDDEARTPRSVGAARGERAHERRQLGQSSLLPPDAEHLEPVDT